MRIIVLLFREEQAIFSKLNKNIGYLGMLFLISIILSCSTSKKVAGSELEQSSSAINSAQPDFSQVDRLLRQQKNAEALKLLDQMIASYPRNAQVYARKGAILYGQGLKKEAMELFVKAYELDPLDQDISYSAAIVASDVKEFEKSNAFIAQCEKTGSINQKQKAKLASLRVKNNALIQLYAHTKDIEISPLSGLVNTNENEYLAAVNYNGSEMLFTRLVNGVETIYSVRQVDSAWSDIKPFFDNNQTTNTGAHTLSTDGQLMIYTVCNTRDVMGACDLYIVVKNNEKWGISRNFGPVINTASWDSQPCLSRDGRQLFFSSDRKGSIGGKDIWVAEKINDKWQIPYNLGAQVNSMGNDESPFLHHDGVTLYFRSDGWQGLGSYDLFMTRYNSIDKTWSKPVNLGLPINTEGNDGALSVASDGITALYTSDRDAKDGQNKNLNIFTFQMPSEFAALPTAYTLLSSTDAVTGQPVNSDIVVIDIESKDTLLNNTLPITSKLLINLPSNKRYAIFVNKENYQYQSSHIDLYKTYTKDLPLQLNFALQPLKSKTPTVLNNLFFDTGSDVINKESYFELDKLVSTMTQNPALLLKITGHTDNIGDTKSNLLLSQKRAQSVVDYLTAKNIPKGRLSGEGMGESKPIGNNDTESGRAKNRRTEVVFY
jgi:outer membrane protein OmpA-like peptidoglycan-associated protein